MFYVGHTTNVPKVKCNSTVDVLTVYKIAMATAEAYVHCALGGKWVWRSLSSRSLSLVGRRHTRLWAPRGQESAPSSVPHAQHLSGAGAAGWSTTNPRKLWGLEEQAAKSQKGQGQKQRKKERVLQVEKTFHVYRKCGLGVRKGSRYSQALSVSFQLLPGHKRWQISQWKVLQQQYYFPRKSY